MAASARSSARSARIVAAVAGLIGFLTAIAVPFLPVRQEQASIQWPDAAATASADVTAPLIADVPLAVEATVPCAVTEEAPPGTVVVSTLPDGAPDRLASGLVVRTSADGGVEVVLRDGVLATATGCDTVTVTSDHTATTVTVAGGPDTGTSSTPADHRPQTVGLFTDLDPDALAGTSVQLDLDSRFSSTPGLLKLAAMIMCVGATVVALVALHRLDNADRRGARRFLPARWWRIGPVDVVVLGTLLVWHVIGANTSDDGYLLTMARVSGDAGYMANYYRWLGVPEAPFGWYYEVLALLSNVSTASMWMRLPALLAGIVCWLVISREVVPRLGARVRHNRVALWTGGLVFLAFWLPYDNGLRPEPIIALGALLTWCGVERSVATRRLLPAALAVLVAAFSLAAGPSGLICVAALIAGSRAVTGVVVAYRRTRGVAAQLLPILAAGTVVLVAVFADQTLATVLESTRVRSAIGPNLAWFEERLRWDALLTISPDGSLARRFGVLVMLMCLVVCVMLVLRKGRIPGTAVGPSRRILGIVFASLLLMMFTPTKWTHHFGVYAGLAGSVAILAAVGVGARSIRSKRNRALFAAGVLFVLALSFTGSNGWWYVASYGVPWWDKPPSIAGKGFSTALLAATLLALLLAAWYHLREPYENGRVDGHVARILTVSPLTIAAAAMVLFEVASLVKGAVAQYPAYSIARSNIDSLAGGCGLADDVLVEQDPTAAILPLREPPSDTDGAGAFGATDATGFSPDGVASDLTADSEEVAAGVANSVRGTDRTTSGTSAGTGGGAGLDAGVNGSTVPLPFGLDRERVPVLGSYVDGGQQDASLTTGWYALPPETADTPIVTISAVGRIRSVDADGVETPGQHLVVEYGRATPDGEVEVFGATSPLDIGPAPSWRNLRVPRDAIPRDADSIRLVADDPDMAANQWLAVTPPRVPQLRTVQDVVGSQAPVMLDWSVGLAFPCQRPFAHRWGVAEVPEYRILPDRLGAEATNTWQDHFGGGPLGWTEELLDAATVPTYLHGDWRRDWGSLEVYTPKASDAVPADVTVTQVDRGGTWSPGPIRYATES
ncbi:arabinosyltransferase [Rhodococcus rhodnii]|uniref:Arabinosyltransferase n=1 Tax=Rhodococcus rhodnii TaxID=38312 RepID=A0A6P2CC46_9NOCA|nr:arabinosyltransferase [Rhodococcus rhodnii]